MEEIDEKREAQKARETLYRLNGQGSYISGKVKKGLKERAFRLTGTRVAKLRPTPARELKAQGVGRNSPCPCGSGKKFKACCIGTI